MATSFGFGKRLFEYKEEEKAPPPNTYRPEQSNKIAYKSAAEWKLGRPGTMGHSKKRRGYART